MPVSANFQPESKPIGGRYRLIQPLGSGGFGQTFSAQDLHLPGHPLCVVKQLKPQVTTAEELQTARRLFDTEAQTLYKLGAHPQIPGLLAHFEEDQEFYLAQELIQGHTLADELGNLWSEIQVVSLLGDLLGILAFVHHHSVIHRDIKPSNLLRRASDNRIVLIDFGAVKQVSTQATALRSGISHTISIGTQGYMPSEQVAGRPQFSSDIYAVGILCIQALTGYPPTELYPDPHSGELEWQRYALQANPALLDVLDRMVRYDFRSRYTNADEALVALRSLPHLLNQYVPEAVFSLDQSPQMTQTKPTVQIGRRRERTQFTESQAVTQLKKPSTPYSLLLPLAVGVLGVMVGLLGWQTWRSDSSSDVAIPLVTGIPADNTSTIAESLIETTTDPAGNGAEMEEVGSLESTYEQEPTVATQPAQISEFPSPVPEPNSELTSEAAQATVAVLYDHLSNRSWDAARSQFDGSLAKQFDPSFFTQFNRVSVENLRITSQSADTVEFLGENTYYYPDGSTQREERTFTVQMQDGQPRIVASDFRSVLQSR